ncbi:ATP synthase F1 subunit delta [Patescibacteria group bacterium]|nr:ATP synthase F1 subunit delta [Patescibacteria group bacterium]MBU4347470.1 ATP synthase F1 subunit delta [Patescibacteria group bacterium]MBU4455322.1 ATP synthase F1 subunit delta [Patescibacteria group bacterium]
MKITPKQYAESLYQSVINKKDSRIKGILDNFVKLLIDNNDISKIDKIIGQFKKIWNREEGIVEAEAVSARELDKKIVKLLNGYIVQLSGARKVLLKQKVDKNILGGVIIKYEDKILDGSLKARLKELRVEMER